MQVNGKIVLFVENHQKEGSSFQTYSTTVSHKNEDGTYINSTMEVQFTKAFLTDEKKKGLKDDYCYTLELKDAWLDTRVFKTKAGSQAHIIFIKVNACDMIEKKKLNKSTNGWN